MSNKVRSLTKSNNILKHLNKHIEERKKFSIIRLGDGCSLTLMHYLRLYNLHIMFAKTGSTAIKAQKIKASLSRKRYGKFTELELRQIGNSIIRHCNKANYIDCLDYFYEDGEKKLLFENDVASRVIIKNWKEVWKLLFIKNKKYCSPFVNLFSIIKDEYNLFNVVEGKTIFCINNKKMGIENFIKFSGAKKVDYYLLPERHSDQPAHFQTVRNIIIKNASKYDLFLIGSGFLGKLYIGLVKAKGGRAFDAGRCFNLWESGDFIPAPFVEDGRFEIDQKSKMMYRRMK